MKPIFSLPPSNGQGRPGKKPVSGQFIARATTGYPRSQRAEDAARWLLGKVEVVPTLKLAAETFGVQPAEVKAAVKRLDESGTTALTDDVVERIVVKIGPERILRVIDKLIEPPQLIAAE
jgi:hypothetical protein